jgi:hypothetical protein
VDKTILVNEDKLAGLQLVRALEEGGIPIDGAYWYQPPEWVNWRLFIVSPWVSELGPLALYRRAQDVLGTPSSPFELRLDDLAAISPADNTYRELASGLTIRPGTMDIDRVADPEAGVGATSPGVWISDAYVYRLRVPADLAHAARRR